MRWSRWSLPVRGSNHAAPGVTVFHRTVGQPSKAPTQWHIVEVLVRNAGRLVTYEQLLQEVWGPTYGKETNYLRVFMTQIRQKLEPDHANPRYFVTEPGIGFRFELLGEQGPPDR